MNSHNVPLPMQLPDTELLRNAVSAIIQDVQRDYREIDQKTADKLGVHKNTIANARNKTADLGALTIARIGAIYGPEYINPYNALYGATAHATSPSLQDPLPELTQAVAALCAGCRTPKQRLDALPVLKAASAALDACIANTEGLRLVA